jgi:hypothetical protein
MAKIIQKPQAPPQAAHAPKILYLGQNADEICDLVSPHIGMMSIDYAQTVNDALLAARAQNLDLIIIDQRGENLAHKLVLPLFNDLGYQVKLVVISPLSEVGDYLRVRGVSRVLTAPVRASQLSRALGLDPEKKRHDKIKLAEEDKKETEVAKAPRRSPLVFISNLGMQLVSTAYKRLAFILLGLLFLSFTFYGAMIGFFLLSSTWAAPQTLEHGHVLVDKIEKELSELHVAGNQNLQHLSETIQKYDGAKREAKKAKILVGFSVDTISKEIASRQRQLKVFDRNIARAEKIQRVFTKQLDSGGLTKDLTNLYGKHLIDKNTFNSNTLGLLETGQRLSGLESQIETLKNDRAALPDQIAMLQSLKLQLKDGGPEADITAASADLLLLAKQALDAKGAFDDALTELDVSSKTRKNLENSQVVINQQIAKLENSTLGRAVSSRINVLFVPYDNETKFKSGAALYTCKFTFVICSQAGTVGQILPGEIASVHPFFGKPIRGFFVEANLTDPQAATQEIIHVGHPPLYF